MPATDPNTTLDIATLLGYGLLAGLISAIWGFSEIIGKFNLDTWRALRTAGAWMLVGVNFLAALLSYGLVAALIPSANSWGAAILVGLAWPTVLRNTSIKLSQPIDNQGQQEAMVRFEEVYARIQNLAQLMINGVLTRQRLALAGELNTLTLKTLERHARQALVLSPLQEEQKMPDDSYVDEIMARKVDDTVKKALLIAVVLNYFGRDTLNDLIKKERKPSNGSADATA
jgi:hypothetical protein